MNRPSYTVHVSREGKWWIVDAPVVHYRTQARTLAEVDEMGRDLIAGSLGVQADSFDLDIHIEMPADVTAKLDEASELERAALNAQARAASDRRDAVRSLRDAHGLSAADTARVLGVTRGRVYQLLDARPTESIGTRASA